MRSCVLALLLLLSLLSATQGIRLDKGLSSIKHQKIHDREDPLMETASTDLEDVNLCKGGHCTGKNRKLITVTTTTTTSSKNKNGGTKGNPMPVAAGTGKPEEEEKFSVNSFPTSENNKEETKEHARDTNLGDIAVMDYSPASRKPPIHN